MKLAEALRALCKRANLTQAGICEKAGFNAISAISNPMARGDMKISTLIKLANAAGYDVMLVRRVNLTGEEPIVIDSAGKHKKED